jgi:hypothetical protein
VGDGSNIKIWGDRWLPTPTSYSVQSPIRILDEMDVVSKLIDGEQGSWKHELIRVILELDEARVILQSPLSPSLPPNRLTWRGTTNDLFSVRSAYHLSKELVERNGGQRSNEEKDQGVWKDLWSLEVPNQVKMFMWRAFQNLLPTKATLYKRKVVKEASCPCCGQLRKDL